MPTGTFKKETFIGAGVVRANGFIIGNVTAAQHTIEKESKSVASRSAGGGDYDALTLISAVALSLTVSDFNDDNLGLALQAQKIDIAATEKTETITSILGGVVPLQGIADIDAGTPAVQDQEASPTVFVEGTDYVLTPFGVEILASGSISDGILIDVTYTPVASTALEAYVASQPELRITAEVINEANGMPMLVEYFKFKPDPVDAFDIFSDEFATLELSGAVLADVTRGAGKSKFMRMVKTKSVMA